METVWASLLGQAEGASEVTMILPFGDFFSGIPVLMNFRSLSMYLKKNVCAGYPVSHAAHTVTYAGWLTDRHFIKPEVTGWRRRAAFGDESMYLSRMGGRVKSDIWHTGHRTMTLDLYIFAVP